MKNERAIQKYSIESPSRMVSMAVVLKNHVVKNQLYTSIVGKNYAHVEGWQFAGGLLGLFPRVVKVENMSSGQETKWFAEVEIVNTTKNEVVSRGFAVCSNKENKKRTFDEYAVLSMAQTRAIGKAYRNLIGWVMKLAGYEATPSEEMTKVGEAYDVTPKKAVDPELLNCHGVGKAGCPMASVITKQELEFSKRMYGKALCRTCQRSTTQLKK